MTTQSIVVDGLVDQGGMTVVGAASAVAALTDGSDSGYLRSFGSARTAVFDCSTFTLPTEARVILTRCSMRVRMESGVLSSATVRYLPPTGTYYSYRNVYPLGSAWESLIGTYQSSTGLPDTQAKIDGARLSIGLQGDVSSITAHVIYVAKPVTAITTIPDNTTTNIIPVAWTNTLDGDGGGQTTYEVKVFTDAQYGAGGFDPDTSTPYWTTGIVTGTVLTVNTGVLVNDTYRAYVRVAQTPSVGGLFWSAWSFDTFVVNVSTADVSTVTPTPSNTNANISVVVARNTGSSAWNFVEVERSTDAGTTWLPVRGATYVDATGSANSFTVVDYETGNGQSVLYRARATRIVNGLPITGSWVQSSPAVSWTSASAWLKSPLVPAHNLAVDVDRPFQTRTYGTRVGVFDVIGSETPVVVTDVVTKPSQTLTIDTITEAESNNLLTLLRDSILLYCPTNCEGSTATQYVAVTGLSMTPTQVRGIVRRRWSVSIVDIAAPADPSASAP